MALVDQNFNGGGSTLLLDVVANRDPVTTNGTNGISRLTQMQARFQQKQLQEKEQKLLRLYESQQQRAFQRVGRGSAGSSSVSSTTSSTTSSSSLGNGKVRQLFDERRTQTKTNVNKTASGWDRSYPLEPLEPSRARHVKSNGYHHNQQVTQLTRGVSLERINTQQPIKRTVTRSRSQARPGNLVNGGYVEQRNRRNDYSDYQDYPDEENDYLRDECDSGYRRDTNRNHYNEEDRGDIDQLLTESRPRLYDEEPLGEGETFDESQLFKKLSNVGGILLMKERTMNEDKYKTYNANNRKVMAPPAAAARTTNQRTTQQPLRRRENDDVAAPPVRAVTRPMAKKPELSPSPPPTNGAPPRRGVPPKSTVTNPSPLRPSSTFNVKGPAPAVPRVTNSRTAPPPTKSPDSPTKPAPARPSPRAAPPQDNLSECKICGRRFASDRVEMHQNICARTGQKKRKVFDPVKQRVKGTEAEAYVRVASKQKPQAKEPAPKKSDWRRKHEEFINAIRAAKEVKAHLAAGGKLSDLPPPPPSENLDYVQCPHCSRRFNETAAERHIPRCADMQHNKPKPKPAAAKAGAAAKKRY